MYSGLLSIVNVGYTSHECGICTEQRLRGELTELPTRRGQEHTDKLMEMMMGSTDAAQ